MRVKLKGLLIGAAVLFMAGALAILSLSGRPLFSFSLPGLSGETESSISDLLLSEMRDLYRLNTVRSLYKLVFPYDFMESEYAETQRLVRELGLSTGPRRFDFVVVTCAVKAGFDLSGTVFAKEHLISADANAAGMLVTGSGAGKTLTLSLPPVAVTELIIEDPSPANYPYPDLNLSPEKWRLVAGFVQARVRQRAADILKTAETRGRDFLRKLLLESGFAEVRFR